MVAKLSCSALIGLEICLILLILMFRTLIMYTHIDYYIVCIKHIYKQIIGKI